MIWSPIAAMVFLVAAGDAVHAQTGSVWVGEGRTFRQENGGWSEYYKGAKAFTFKEVDRGPGYVGLYDATRGIRVELSATSATVVRGSKTLFAYSGRWSWRLFVRSDKKGYFIREADGNWAEYFEGKVIFKFQETGRGKDLVVLFDASRGFEVRLTGTQAIVTSGSRTILTYNGRFAQ